MEVALKKIVSDYNKAQGLNDATNATNAENPLAKVRMVLLVASIALSDYPYCR